MRDVQGALAFLGLLLALPLSASSAEAAVFDLARVADLSTAIPNGTGDFTAFSEPLLSGGNVAVRDSRPTWVLSHTGRRPGPGPSSPPPSWSRRYEAGNRPHVSARRPVRATSTVDAIAVAGFRMAVGRLGVLVRPGSSGSVAMTVL